MTTIEFPQLAVGDWITSAARRWPDAVCFVSPVGALDDVVGARRQTYAQTNERVTRLAHALVDKGFTKSDRIGILSVDKDHVFFFVDVAPKLADSSPFSSAIKASLEITTPALIDQSVSK